MKYLYYLTLVLLLSSCNSKSKNESGKIDTLGHVETIESEDTTEDTDSIALVKKYGESLHIAYNNLKFGITKKQYNKLAKSIVNIGGAAFFLNPLISEKDKILIGVELDTEAQSADYIDAGLQDDLERIATVIESKYGQPQMDLGKPEFFKFKPGYIQWVKKWKIANKVILIGMEEIYSGSEYKTVCQIYDYDLNLADDVYIDHQKAASRNTDANKF